LTTKNNNQLIHEEAVEQRSVLAQCDAIFFICIVISAAANLFLRH